MILELLQVAALTMASQFPANPAPNYRYVQSARGPVLMPAWYEPALTAAAQDAASAWTVTSGQLPPGMALSATGQLTGTPTKAGTYTFTVRYQTGAGTVSQTFTMTIQPGRSLGPPPPPGEVGVAYSHQFGLVQITEQEQ